MQKKIVTTMQYSPLQMRSACCLKFSYLVKIYDFHCTMGEEVSGPVVQYDRLELSKSKLLKLSFETSPEASQ